MKKQLLLLGMGLLGTLSLHAQENPWVGQPVQEGTFYLYNVETGLWLQDNDKKAHYEINGEKQWWWTTHANAGTRGMDFDLISLGDDNYQIDPKFGHNHSINSGSDVWYMDTGHDVSAWVFEPSTEYDGAYYIYSGSAVMALDAEGNISSEGEALNWKLVTYEERLAQLEEATAENPVDATWLIGNPNFSNQNDRISSWVRNSGAATPGGGKGFGLGGDGYLGCNAVWECWNCSTVDMYQDVTLPNGKYIMTVQGFYRDGSESALAEKYEAGTEEQRLFYYAGTVKKPFMTIMQGASSTFEDLSFGIQISDKFIPGNLTGGNAMERASKCIFEGHYMNEPIETTVTGGSLRIGVEKTSGVYDDWCIYDNFTLTYYGNNVDISDYVNALQDAIDKAEAVEGDLTTAMQNALNEAVNKGKDLLTSTDTEAMTEATATLTSLTDDAKTMAGSSNVDVLRRTEALTDGSDDAGVQAANAAALDALANAMKIDEINTALNALRIARKYAAADKHEDIFTGNAPAANGEYYIYNVGRKQFLCGGNDWGAHASLGFPGIIITLEAADEGYFLNTHLSNGHNNDIDVEREYLNYGGYMDTDGKNPWKFVDAGNGTYNIVRVNQDTDEETGEVSNYMLGFRPGTLSNVDTDMLGADDPNNQWKLVTKADRDALLSEASGENPVDASYLIGAPNFNQREDVSAWAMGNFNIWGRGENHVDFAIEAWNTESASLNQVMTDLLPGYYVISFQGFYRDGDYYNHASIIADGGTPAQLAHFYANDSEDLLLMPVTACLDMAPGLGQVHEIGEFPYDIPQACDFFQSGLYKQSLVVNVSDSGELEFGVDKFDTATERDWIVLDNFRLVYYGEDEPVTAINGIQEVAPAVEGKIYNLQGVQVKNAAQRGIYIKNGKKFIVK